MQKFDLLADMPKSVSSLRSLILRLAVQGRLVPQDSSDEPASSLLRRAVAARQTLVDANLVRRESIELGYLRTPDPDLPPGWVRAPLAAYTGVIMGQSPPSDSYNKSREGLPFYQGKAQFGPLYPQPSDWCTEPTKIGEPDDVVISVRAPVGPTNLLRERSCIGRGLAALRSLGGDPMHLLYTLRALEASIAAMGVGSTFVAISKDDLDTFSIPLPPLAEQRRIVAKVDELMALCDRLEAQQQQREHAHAALTHAALARFAEAPTAETLEYLFHAAYGVDPGDFRAAIVSMAVVGKLTPQESGDEPADHALRDIRRQRDAAIKAHHVRALRPASPIHDSALPFDLPHGWTRVRLSEIVMELQTGPFGSTLHKEDYRVGGTPVINPASYPDGTIVPIRSMAVDTATVRRLSEWQLRAGDIVVARRGEMGRCAVVTDREDGWLCGTGSLILRMPNCLHAPFLAMLIGSPKAREYLGGASVGTTMRSLNHSILERMPLALPPLAEQRRIVAKVNDLMALVNRLEADLAAARSTGEELMDAVVAELTAAN